VARRLLAEELIVLRNLFERAFVAALNAREAAHHRAAQVRGMAGDVARAAADSYRDRFGPDARTSVVVDALDPEVDASDAADMVAGLDEVSHRDLKPQNLPLEGSAEWRRKHVVDLGYGKVFYPQGVPGRDLTPDNLVETRARLKDAPAPTFEPYIDENGMRRPPPRETADGTRQRVIAESLAHAQKTYPPKYDRERFDWEHFMGTKSGKRP
jgi:hypothetical protein